MTVTFETFIGSTVCQPLSDKKTRVICTFLYGHNILTFFCEQRVSCLAFFLLFIKLKTCQLRQRMARISGFQPCCFVPKNRLNLS